MNANSHLLDVLWAAIKRWHLRRSAICTLNELNDYMLRDIGIQRPDIPGVVADKLKAQCAGSSGRTSSSSTRHGAPGQVVFSDK